MDRCPVLQGCWDSSKNAGPAGELVSTDRDSRVILHGREVISERECTRDAEWKLLHVTLQRSSSHSQASALPWLQTAQRVRAFSQHGKAVRTDAEKRMACPAL